VNAFSLAYRNLARQRRRTLLIEAVVAFGFAALALATGFMIQSFDSLRAAMIQQIGHLQVMHPSAATNSEETTLEFGIPHAVRARALAATVPSVVAVLPRIEWVGLVTNGTRSVPYLGLGVDPGPEFAATRQRELVVEGSYLQGDGGDEIVMGTGLARALGVRTGDQLTLLASTVDGSLNAVDVRVRGLLAIPIKELNDRTLVGGITLVSQLLHSEGTVSKLVVFLRSERDLEAASAALAVRLAPIGPVAIVPWRTIAVFYSQVRLLYTAIFGFVNTVLVLMVVLSAAIVMTMAVAERTREVGTLRALGTRPARIRNTFLAEGVLIALAGSIAGLVLALAVRAALNASGIILPPPPGAAVGMPIHVGLYPSAYLFGLAVMVGTMLLASFFPARRAAHLSIVEALTHV
jgi:putative ABC transport system permease protein